jgi:hypothetical protein
MPWNSYAPSGRENPGMPRLLRWAQGRRLFAVLATAIAIVSLGMASARAFDTVGIREVIRFTARTSLVLFSMTFAASAASRRWPSAWTRWQRDNSRYLGASFAASHLVHAIAIVTFVVLAPAQFRAVHPDSSVPGLFGYAIIGTLLATSSFDPPALAPHGPRTTWLSAVAPIAREVGMDVLWIIFMVSEASRLRANPVHAPFVAILLLAATIRAFAWVRKPAHSTPAN